MTKNFEINKIIEKIRENIIHFRFALISEPVKNFLSFNVIMPVIFTKNVCYDNHDNVE